MELLITKKHLRQTYNDGIITDKGFINGNLDIARFYGKDS